jgi:hypothetical protein
MQRHNRDVRITISERPDGGRKIMLDARHTRASDIERLLRTLTDETDK